MSLLTDNGGITFPNVKFRPNAKTTTPWGHDVDPVVGGYRFHRAVDRAGGDGLVYCPFSAIGAKFEENLFEYGTLLRLFYPGWEIRIAHMTALNPEFRKLLESYQPIPAGTVIGQEGNAGKSTGKHTHTEIVVTGGKRNSDIDEILVVRGIEPGLSWSLGEQLEQTKDRYEKLRSWKKRFGVQSIGSHELTAWDRRTNGFSIWFDSKSVFGF